VRATPLLKQSQRAGGRFASDQAGNIAPIFALSLLAVMGIVGMGVDYSQLSTRKATLDSLADSASLAGVTPSLLSQTDQASINAATTLFNSQTSTVKGIRPVTLNVTASDNALQRTLTVSYQTTSKTSFGGLIGVNSATIS
jgi:Flp pilus assembly protein TadG